MAFSPHSRSAMMPYLMLAPAVALTIAFTFYPVANTFYLSMHYYVLSDLKNSEYIQFENFKAAFHDPQFWGCLKFSVIWTFLSVSLQFAAGLIGALLLNHDFRGRGLYRAIVLCPWAISGVVVGLIWSWMFHGQVGVVNNILMGSGVIERPIPWISETPTAMATVIMANVWRGMPFFAVTLLAALQTIPPELYEAVEVDGGGPWAKFRHVTMPLIKEMVLVTVLLRTIWTFNNVDLIYIMTRGGPANSTQTLATYIFTRAQAATDYGYGAALAVILFFLLLGAIFVVFKAGAYAQERAQ